VCVGLASRIRTGISSGTEHIVLVKPPPLEAWTLENDDRGAIGVHAVIGIALLIEVIRRPLNGTFDTIMRSLCDSGCLLSWQNVRMKSPGTRVLTRLIDA
jgi:hypothetical protein